jgi:hypothetical protein
MAVVKKTIKMTTGLIVVGWFYEVILVESFPLWLPWFCGRFGGMTGAWTVQGLSLPLGKFIDIVWKGFS